MTTPTLRPSRAIDPIEPIDRTPRWLIRFSRSLLAVSLFALALVASVVSAGIPTSPEALTATSKPTAGKSEKSETRKAVSVDLNGAGIDELVQVPGIGKAMAKRIIDFRKEHGRFDRVDDLLKVQGIGEKSLEKLRPYLKVGREN